MTIDAPKGTGSMRRTFTLILAALAAAGLFAQDSEVLDLQALARARRRFTNSSRTIAPSRKSWPAT